jgi:hypothetical protein
MNIEQQSHKYYIYLKVSKKYDEPPQARKIKIPGHEELDVFVWFDRDKKVYRISDGVTGLSLAVAPTIKAALKDIADRLKKEKDPKKFLENTILRNMYKHLSPRYKVATEMFDDLE